MVGHNIDGPMRDRVMKLIDEKDRIESEIRNETAVLQSNNIGMHDPLVDQDGYPRNDIDVYKVRHARHRIICLQNDHKALMKAIERGIADVHSDFIGSSGEGSSVNGHANGGRSYESMNGHNGHSNGRIENSQIHQQSFAIVGVVHDGSPADLAGLSERDEVVQFGSVNHENFLDVSQILNIVTHSVGQRITVKVRRNQQIVNLTVVPRPWAQPGLLGCHIQRI